MFQCFRGLKLKRAAYCELLFLARKCLGLSDSSDFVPFAGLSLLVFIIKVILFNQTRASFEILQKNWLMSQACHEAFVDHHVGFFIKSRILHEIKMTITNCSNPILIRWTHNRPPAVQCIPRSGHTHEWHLVRKLDDRIDHGRSNPDIAL